MIRSYNPKGSMTLEASPKHLTLLIGDANIYFANLAAQAAVRKPLWAVLGAALPVCALRRQWCDGC